MSVTYPDQQEEEEAGPIKTWRFGVYHLNQKDLSIDALPKCLIYRKSIRTPISSALKKKNMKKPYFLAASSATAAIVAAPLLGVLGASGLGWFTCQEVIKPISVLANFCQDDVDEPKEEHWEQGYSEF